MRFEMNLQSMTKNELRATSAYLAALASDSDHVAVACDAQPAVADNTGSLEPVAPKSPAGDQAGNEEGAVAAAPSSTVTQDAPARRTRRTKAEIEAARMTEQGNAQTPPPAAAAGEQGNVAAAGVSAAQYSVQSAADISKTTASKRTGPTEPTGNAQAPAAADSNKCNLDGVREALQHYTATHGMAPGIELLQRYGAGRISELAPEQYEQFVAECAEA